MLWYIKTINLNKIEPFNFKEYLPTVLKLQPSLFHSLIKSSHFNIPILFCQKWREKCYNFNSIWNKIGECYHDNNDLIISSIDTSHYSSIEEELKVKIYPTIIIFDKNGGKIEYNKDQMDYEDIIEFINDSCGVFMNIKPDDNDNNIDDDDYVDSTSTEEEKEKEKKVMSDSVEEDEL